MDLTGKNVLVTGGTGSLGSTLVRKLLVGAYGNPAHVTVFSRDEDKQYTMRLANSLHISVKGNGNDAGHGTPDGPPARPKLRLLLGDVRDYGSLVTAVRDQHVVFHAAALKQVPQCEYAPEQAVLTNALGACNVVRAIAEHGRQVEVVVGISTDKACEPINVMGMTKALQERILIEGNIKCPTTRFVCVRYGNVIASRGSAIPIFVRQIREGGPVTITDPEMTRFLITLDGAVETIAAAVRTARPGETYIPKIPAARMVDAARALMGSVEVPITYLGIRPGEKVHETLVSSVECLRTQDLGDFYAIRPMLPEISHSNEPIRSDLSEPYTSRAVTADVDDLRVLLADYVVRTGGAGVTQPA
jgi:UDP-glucose 4-epimerase